MSAHHTRFEHSLGVVIIASRIFEKILEHQGKDVDTIINSIWPKINLRTQIPRIKQELRLAALLHDTGHSLFSHTSEHVYGKIHKIQQAKEELSDLTGKSKGAGEVLSFCLAKTDSIQDLLGRAKSNLLEEEYHSDEYQGEIDFNNVALMIVGRSVHPYLQFLGDIISSGFDADKLDYLLRDATNAGLPLRYDLERYLFSVCLEKNLLADDEGKLESLYRGSFSGFNLEKREAGDYRSKYPCYETYRMRLPVKALNTIEQIIICKLMLFSYIYHHQKVRAAEGLLQKILERLVKQWRDQANLDDDQILAKFLDFTDLALDGDLKKETINTEIEEYRYRIMYRLLPREVYSLGSPSASHAERKSLSDFLAAVIDPDKKITTIRQLEIAIGSELLRQSSNLATDPEEALWKAGVWVDAPKSPEFEDIEELIMHRPHSGVTIPLPRVFPIGEWLDAYKSFRYRVRIFCFSEYRELVQRAARRAMETELNLVSNEFYQNILRRR